ncbi:MAG TPA: CAT RNA binding domain-containing protein, partial [Microbacterium sp.]|nr:CAT RNA binding domain-containing protein [Microbacterium sp.]
MSSTGDAARASRAPGAPGGASTAPVHKVLNNNVVIQIDDAGRERVLMGRGLGFGLKPTDPIDTS